MLLLYIKNTSQLLSDDLNPNQLILREIGLQALEKSIYAVKPKMLMKNSVRIMKNKLFIQNDEFDLTKFNNIFIIGGGKATAEMALSLERFLKSFGEVTYEGIINIPINTKNLDLFENSKIKINLADHPIPNEQGIKGTRSMMDLIENSKKNDLIFCLISGGGSALLPLPKPEINLKDLQKINSLLLSSGASIHEINIIRKHLSDFKGGNLAKKLYNSSGATLISLIISDVVGDDLDSVASGPTIPDKTTFRDALKIIKKYSLLKKIPTSIRNYIETGLGNQELENPKINDPCFSNIHNYLIGSVSTAIKETSSLLKQKGFKVTYFSKNVTGEARNFGKSLFPLISKYFDEKPNRENSKKIALIGSGELTVTIKGKGVGGRNQEMLLSFLAFIMDKNYYCDFLIIGANLDGLEGNSKACGALVDNTVVEQMRSKKIDPNQFLRYNDSNSFFKKLGSELITGPTGCNVNDLILILISS